MPGYDAAHENDLSDVFHKLRFKPYGERDIRQWAKRQDRYLTGCLNDPPHQFDCVRHHIRHVQRQTQLRHTLIRANLTLRNVVRLIQLCFTA
jgi:hypothetical protein